MHLMSASRLNRYYKQSIFLKILKKDYPLYLMSLPGVILIFVFCYIPVYGVLISFMERYNPAVSFFSNKWVGFKHFAMFFRDPYCFIILKNTVLLGVYTLIFTFPAPIILALLFNEIRNVLFKRVTQTISYMPYFLSTVIVIGIMIELVSYRGVINDLLQSLFGYRINFMERPEWFRPLYIISAIWQHIGFSSIIYLASLSGINPELYHAAMIDGAGRWKQVIHITLPGITPVITILLILSVSGIVGNDFQKILLMYKPLTYETADVVSTYIYRCGIEGASFSYASAVGLFMSLISFMFLYITNSISRLLSETSLW